MAESAITCIKCGMRQDLSGTEWEVEIALEMWQRQHRRTAHYGENVIGWRVEPGAEPEPGPRPQYPGKPRPKAKPEL